MAIEIVVPRLGWSMDEGQFSQWLKQDGDYVNRGDMIFELEGDKSVQEIESFDAGILRIAPNAPKPGETVVVGQFLGYLVDENESVEFKSKDVKKETVVTASHEVEQEPIIAVESRIAKSSTTSRTTITPRARRVARELGFDWSGVVGTGRNGRIRERDIRSHVDGSQSDPATLAGERIPITRVRRTIAERMLAGMHQAAPVTLTTKADATILVDLRNRMKTDESIAPSYTDMLMKLTAVVLDQHPAIQTQWRGDDLFTPSEINIAIAVDTPTGLFAPVLRDVPSKSLRQLAAESRELIALAQNSKLSAAQMQGGTFTITNLGAHAIDAFTPIINLPQSAVLGIGRIVREPVVVGDEIVTREMMTLSLTFDHRVIDGGPAARYLNALRQCIEQPAAHLVE